MPGKRRNVQPKLAGFACQKVIEPRMARCRPRSAFPAGCFLHPADAYIVRVARDPTGAAVAFNQQDGFHSSQSTRRTTWKQSDVMLKAMYASTAPSCQTLSYICVSKLRIIDEGPALGWTGPGLSGSSSSPACNASSGSALPAGSRWPMTRRHRFRHGDWESAALRLDEIICAHSGEDPFEEALKLLVAKLMHELEAVEASFLARQRDDGAVDEVNRLLRAAEVRWRGVLDPGATTRLSGPELMRCASVLNHVRLLADEMVGLDAIFEFIVAKSAKGQKGQYFTPRHVIAEVVAMVRPTAGESVVDPACGSGGFLRHALVQAPHCSVWGFDQDPRALRVARVMLAASGQATARVMRIDSLRRPEPRIPAGPEPVLEDLVRAQEPGFRGFDVVLTNPPFAGDVGCAYADAYELARGQRAERDVLFLERCVQLLKPQGRLAIVLPHNKVGAERWAYLRSWLLEQIAVVAVLGLGRNTFRPHTSQKACVVIGCKRPKPTSPHPEEEILFFISERDGKDHRGRLALNPDGQAIDHDLAQFTPLVRRRFELLQGGA